MGTTTYDANRRIYRESKLKTANQMMIRLLYGALAIGFLMSFWHSTWLQLALVGVPAALVPTYLIRTAPYARTTRVGVGMALMIFAGLFIFESHGVTEFHFAVFVGLAFLLAYRDWVVIVAAAATIAVHHVAFAVLQLIGAPVFLYSTTLNPILLTVFHAVFVVLEAGVLIPLAHEGYAEWARMEEMHRITRALAGENKSGVQAGIKVVLESLEGQLTEAETRGSKALSNVRDVELMAKNQAERAEAAAFAVSKTYDLANRLKSGVAQEVQELTCMTNQLAESRNALAAMETHTLAQKDGVQQALTGSKKATDAVFATLQTADAASKRGAAAAEASKAAVSGLDSQVEQVAESVRTLGSRASQIRGILKTIQDVSEQTNLLALNAAIEAARAGTHGAGFAIVADEVRKLAGRTNDAAAEVAMVIQDMNAQIAETLGNVIGSDEHPGLQDATTTAVETLLTEIEDMRKDLDSIKDASNIAATITGDNTEVFRSIESLAAAVNKAVNEGRSKIDDLTASVQRFEGLVSDHGVVATETLSEANFLLQSVQEVSALCEETSASSAEVRLSIDETQGFLVSIRENVTAAEAA